MMAPPADAVLAAVRAVHFAGTLLLFGQFVFAAAIAPGRPGPHFLASSAWSIAVVVASALAWLALEAISMSGLPASDALSAATLGAVVTQTQFGRVWLARMLVCAGLIAVMAGLRGVAMRVPGAALSALLVVALAGMGHGGSGRGLAGLLHLGGDAAHLLAAGAWLGALVPLIFLLERARRAGEGSMLRFAAEATRRFSALGVASMAVVLASGVLNAWYMVPSRAALFDSQYGQLLLMKILLFVAIVAIAAVNRQRLTPRLLAAREGADGVPALHSLGQNAIVECLLGLGIIAIVGELGITIPGPHPMGR